jgi:cyclopropane fatty-acyl-phospholipid synthase-like methyltransferase
MNVPTNWYETFFQGVSLDLWRKAISPKQTKREADFLAKALKCEVGSHFLDAPCGNGRLSIELARRGFKMTGVDLAGEFIEEARAAAAALPGASAKTRFILRDMRRIEGKAIYDGAYCFGNSFGFLEYGDMGAYLNGVSRALKTGGRFAIETGMAAESVLQKFEPVTSHQIADITVTIKERYLAEESCIDTEYVFEQNGIVESRNAKHWIYTVAEIRRMVEAAGLSVLKLTARLSSNPSGWEPTSCS